MNSCEHPACGLSAIEVRAFTRNSGPLRIVKLYASNNYVFNKTQRNLS